MTEWPWLMIILALISTIQWPNSTAQHTYDYNSYWEGYLWSPARNRPKRTSLFDRDTTTTSSFKENQKNEPAVTNIKNVHSRDTPTTNLTKSLFKNENINTTNNTNKQHNSSLKLPQTKSSSIVFPSSINEKMQSVKINKFIPEPHVIEKCSLNESFCIKVDNYPRQDLINIFRTSKYMSNSYFGTDIVNEITDLETRLSNSNLQPFCESKEDVIFPEAGITKNNEWRYIIQDPNNDNTSFKQGIRVEKCINAGTTCKFNDLLPNGYTTTCVQKYIYKKLVAIKDSKEIYYESFKLPSCCECMYSINPDLLTRKGGLGEELEGRRFHQSESETSKRNKDVINKQN
ncbi:protein spaetzle-like [Melanaphis sacchari]|uniref:Protein spaetzle n=1 Tax=Melanaphis sacchari TaxID=742174 RepID=A0A2H8TH37_9HEMI|nr:protein spaetzle-like [Melanaphis sacchari]